MKLLEKKTKLLIATLIVIAALSLVLLRTMPRNKHVPYLPNNITFTNEKEVKADSNKSPISLTNPAPTGNLFKFSIRYKPEVHPFREAKLLFNFKNSKNSYYVSLDRDEITLNKLENGRSIKLGAAAVDWRGEANIKDPIEVLIQRKENRIKLALNSRVIISTMDSAFHSGRVAIVAKNSSFTVKAKRPQKLNKIFFTDDFMRTKDSGQWDIISGVWEIKSVKGIEKSPNAFSLFSRFVESPQYNELFAGRTRDYVGIGIRTSYINGKMRIRAVFFDTPAWEAGLRAGDEILEVDGVSTANMKREDIIERILGKEGTTVKLKVARRNSNFINWSDAKRRAKHDFDVKEFTVKRKRIELDSINRTLSISHISRSPSTEKFFQQPELDKKRQRRGTYQEKAIIVAGYDFWSDYVFKASAKSLGWGSMGMVFYFQDERNYYLFEWNGWQKDFVNPNNSQELNDTTSTQSLDSVNTFRLIRLKDGTRKVLAEKRGGFIPNQYYEMVVGIVGARITVLVDGNLIFNIQQDDLAWGKVGLYAAQSKGVYFDDVYVASISTSSDIYKITRYKEGKSNFHASRIFRKDRFMKRWANRAQDWRPDTSNEKTDLEMMKEGNKIRTYRPFSLLNRYFKRNRINWKNRVNSKYGRTSTKTAYWHKYLFFGDVSFEMTHPLFNKKLDVVINASAYDWFSGYRLTLDSEAKTVSIYREGILVREGKFSSSTLKHFRFERKGATIKAELTSRRSSSKQRLRILGTPTTTTAVLSFKDSNPLPGARVGIRGVKPGYDLGSIKVSSPNVLEYSFDSAPVDWAVTSGRWGVMNRWVCDQRWSFFGGRSDAIAAIWNKYKFEGDISVNFYAAMMMPSYWKSPYEQPGDICVTICGDGENVSSGYSLILGGGHNSWTRLYRKDKIIGETFSPRFLLPRREISDEVELRLHERWFQLNLRKIGNRIQFLFNGRLCFDFDDDEPLKGKRVAIWTTDNGIIISRVRIAFEKRAPRTLYLEDSVPFNDGKWTNIIYPNLNREHSATDVSQIDIKSAHIYSELSKQKRPKINKAIEYKISNRIGGGFFAVEPSIGVVNVSKNPVIEFEYKITPDVKIDFYFDYIGLLHRIIFTGPPRTHYDVITLGKFPNVIADGKWHRTSFNVLDALKEMYPLTVTSSKGENNHLINRSPFVIENTTFANYSNYHYLLSGFGGNWSGATYSIRNFKIALPSKDKVPPRVLSVSFPFDKTYANNVSKVIFLLEDEGGSGIDAGKLKLKVNGKVYTLSEPAGSKFPANHRAGRPDAQRMGQNPMEYNYVEEKLTFDIPRAGIALKDGDRITVELYGIADRAGNISKEKVKRSWIFDLRKDNSPPQDVKITCSRDYLINYDFDQNAPPLMAWNLYQYGFYPVKPRSKPLQEGAGGWLIRYPRLNGNSSTHYKSGSAAKTTTQADITHKPFQKTYPNYSLKVINRRIAHDFGVGFCKEPYNAGRYPILSFDYNIPPWVAIDISLETKGISLRSNRKAESDRRAILFASSNFRYDLRAYPSYDILGKIKGVKHDGWWHRVDVNIYKLLKNYDPTMMWYNVNDIHFGDDVTGRLGNYERACFYLDNVRIEPIISARDLKFSWTANDISGIVDYRSAFNNIPDYTPLGKVSEEDYYKAKNGFAYFHLMLKDGAGNWTQPIHYRVFLDSTPPKILSMRKKLGWDDTIIIEFEEENGIDPQSIRLKVGEKVLTVDDRMVWINQSQKRLDYMSLMRLSRRYKRNQKRASLNQQLVGRRHTVLTCRLAPITCPQEEIDKIFGDKDSVTVTLLSAADFAGNKITRQPSIVWKRPQAVPLGSKGNEDLGPAPSLIDELFDIFQR